MKPEPADQDELQRMFARKRQEQPPQQFLRGLSTAVIDRIQHPDPPLPPTLWQRLGLDFDSKQVLVCMSGVAVCGLLAYGLISSRHLKEPPPSTVAPLGVPPTPAQIGSTPPVKAPGSKPKDMPRSGDPVRAGPASGDPMAVRPWPAPAAPVQGGK